MLCADNLAATQRVDQLHRMLLSLDTRILGKQRSHGRWRRGDELQLCLQSGDAQLFVAPGWWLFIFVYGNGVASSAPFLWLMFVFLPSSYSASSHYSFVLHLRSFYLCKFCAISHSGVYSRVNLAFIIDVRKLAPLFLDALLFDEMLVP